MNPILFQDDRIVIRGAWKDGEFHVTVHHKINGVEFQPRGYWLGSNSLTFKERK